MPKFPEQKVTRRIHRRLEPRPFDPAPINPAQFYRYVDGPKIFGYSASSIDGKIATEEIPMPVPLSDNGRAKGWFGDQILEWREKRKAAASNPTWQAKHKKKKTSATKKSTRKHDAVGAAS